MYLRRLVLTNVRNYEKQELDLAPGNVLLLGQNAQGKTNLLEAAFLLAAGRSERAASDADFITWPARDEPQPFARVAGEAVRRAGDVTVELTVVGRPGAGGRLVASKRFRLNGVPRRASDVVGTITAVLFTTDDMELVKGPPAGRRRYLDVMLTQADRGYARALSRYGRLLTQRNALLKSFQEGAARTGELAYWDDELARDGGVLVAARAAAAGALSGLAAELHGRLSAQRERFDLAYQPRSVEGGSPERLASATAEEAAAALLARLQATHARDVAAGMTLSGPHRDDLGMTLDGEPAAAFASRGQQRTAALALRLAEACFLEGRAGERPLLLLDDVLSELDESRRGAVLAAIEADQVLITSPDEDRFAPAFRERAQVWRIAEGVARPDRPHRASDEGT